MEGKEPEVLLVDEVFIERERREIEDQFTYVLPKKRSRHPEARPGRF